MNISLRDMAASNSQERDMENDVAPDPSSIETLKKSVVECGNELLKPSRSMNELLQKLDKLEDVLSETIHEFKELFEADLKPLKDALIANDFTRHAEFNVRVSVASCISEIIRILAPDDPYEEDQMMEYFHLAVSAFRSLSCKTGRAYSKAVSILGNISCCQSCVLMLDLQLHNLVHHMFHLFLNVIRGSHSDAIFSNMENIMTLIIRNNVDCDDSVFELSMILLARLKKQNQDVSPVAFRLAENTFKNCSNDLKTYLPEAVRCLGIPVEEYAEIVVSLFYDANQREDMDTETVENVASCRGEAGLPIDGGSSSLAESNGTENLETRENSHENQHISQCCHEPDNLGSPKQQQEMQPEAVPIRGKRNRKPISLMKIEEGYDPSWMLGSCTSMRNPRGGNNKRKKMGHESEDSLGSPEQQVQPEDVSNRRMKSPKPNSLMKLEEGYDPSCMLGSCTSMRESYCENKKGKKIGRDPEDTVGSPKQQVQPEDVSNRGKRSPILNSLTEIEEGYDPSCMLGSCTPMRESHCENKKGKKIGRDPEDTLGSPKQQVQPEDVPIREKRSRKPNSSMKLEEGYDPSWMLGSCTSMRESHSENKQGKKIGHPQKNMISKGSPLSSGPAGQQSSALISRKANMDTAKREVSLKKVPVEEKRKCKINDPEDIEGVMTAKWDPESSGKSARVFHRGSIHKEKQGQGCYF